MIYNRLRERMVLGIDATHPVRAERARDRAADACRTSRRDSPYNTRRRAGLPPTPISNPGLASIRAAANPARVDYLYFVRKPDKVHHFFTASEAEHEAKKCEYGFGC